MISTVVSSAPGPMSATTSFEEVMPHLTDWPVRTYHRGDVLLSNPARSSLHLLIDGKAKVGPRPSCGKMNIYDIIEAGGVFGGLVPNPTQSLVQIISPRARIIVFRPDELPKLPESVQAHIYRMINQRIAKLERQLENAMTKEVTHRIIDLLCQLGRQRGERVGLETKVAIDLTHADLAALVGTSRQTLTTTFGWLRKKNIINYNRQYILIRDLRLLEAINAQDKVRL